MSTKNFITAKGQPSYEKIFSLSPSGVAGSLSGSLSLCRRPGSVAGSPSGSLSVNFLFSHNGNLTARGYGIFTAEPRQDQIRRFISHHQLQPLFPHPPILSFGSFEIFPASFISKKFCIKPRSPGIPIRQISSSHSETFLSKSEKQELKVNIILNCLFITFWKFRC